MVNITGETVASLAVSAFPTVPLYVQWLGFLSEVLGIPLETAVHVPHCYTSNRLTGEYSSFYIDETVLSGYFSGLRLVETSIPFARANEPELGLAYTEKFEQFKGNLISPVEKAVQNRNFALLLWMAEREIDPNWLSRRQPLWFHLAKHGKAIPGAVWEQLSDIRVVYKPGRERNRQYNSSWQSEYVQSTLLTVLEGGSDSYRMRNWLKTALNHPGLCVETPIKLYIAVLQAVFPSDFTRHYLSLFLGSDYNSGCFSGFRQHITPANVEEYL